MIWAALLIGVTVFLAIRSIRTPIDGGAHGGPRDWLVLPDEPRTKAVVLPALPAVEVIYPTWTACSDESWRAEKPLHPWFRSPAPYAVAAAFGAVSLDLTALGLGVPEIVPTHRPLHDHGQDHHLSDGFRFPAEPAPALFETAADHGGFGLDLVAWDKSDFIVPSWDHAPSHDWWA
jgi:hypothetical protein